MAKNPLPAGTKIGDFVTVRVVGQGGFGCVYEAHHAQLGDKWKAAIKELIHPDPAMVDRFLVEAQLLLGLHHPNIPKIFALTEYKGRKFIIMEWIDGGTLYHAAYSRQIAENQLVRVAIEACTALEAAHTYRPMIIHRDVKAENIMVRWGADFHVWLMDFGVARALDSQRQSRTVVGTKYFACPEQLRGMDPHPSFDIWSLGGTLFHVMGPYTEDDTRFPPFPYERGDGPAEVERRLAGYSSYSPAFKAIVLRAMAYTAADRYQTATDMRRALEKIAGYPVSHATAPPSPPDADPVPPPSGPTSTVTQTGWLPVRQKK